jgi:uncharacterized protein (TIGR02246 family)
MKAFLLFLGLFELIAFKSLSQPNDVEIIKKLNRQWLDAIAQKDSASLAQILSDDFVLIAPNGAKHTKKDNLENIMSPGIAFSMIHIDSVEVRILTKEVSILTCWSSFVVKTAGKEMPGKNSYQDVYVKRKGKWLAVSGHVSLRNPN